MNLGQSALSGLHQEEMDQLRSEIDRIADSANFNGIKLLNGEMNGTGDVTVTEGAIIILCWILIL